MNTYLQKLCELIPLALFFIFYKKFDIFTATAVMICTSLSSLLLLYLITRKVSGILLFSAIISAISGGITIYSQDATYIKVKPTVLYTLFSCALIIGRMADKNFLQVALGNALSMPKKQWWQLTYSMAFFFLGLAMLNEIIWRNFAESVWVNFKVFGIIPLNLCFVCMQLYKYRKYLQNAPVTDNNRTH